MDVFMLREFSFRHREEWMCSCWECLALDTEKNGCVYKLEREIGT